MALVIGGLISLVGAGFARIFTIEVLKFIAWRALVIGAMVTLLPAVLHKVFTDLLAEGLTYASTYVGQSTITGQMISLTGMGGWIAEKLRLSQCLSIYLSLLSLRFVLSFMRRSGI